ncbi:MAG: hypothetical protein ACTHLO_01020 [Pseudolabrys sp.]
MAPAIALALVKLLLSVGIFAVTGYLGRFHDKRIAGVLLTFPILNGIGILTGGDPLAVANSIYAVVVVNGLLLFVAIRFAGVLPPLPSGVSANATLAARLVVWTLIWAVGAWSVVNWRDALPGPGVLITAQCILAALVVAVAWRAPRKAEQAPARVPFLTFWSSPAGSSRIAIFTLCCVALLAAANSWESKWVGMLSALPLPGLFAVATLSVLETRKDFAVIGDSVLFGPIFVIAFNWTYAHIVVRLPATGHTIIGLAALLVLLAVNAALIFWIVPRISAYLDARRKV